ncbi:MAG: type IX secretion system sortase PorU, partial [Bacteroidota bacterium]
MFTRILFTLLTGPGNVDIRMVQEAWESFDPKGIDDQLSSINETIKFESAVGAERRQYKGTIWFVPIRKNPQTGQFERLTEFVAEITHRPGGAFPGNRRNGPSVSQLANGDIYKIGVSESGMYKLTYTFLKDELGIDIDNANPAKIKVLGNGGGMLPERNSAFRYDNLQETAILTVGMSDGNFDADDYILFYGQGPSIWTYNQSLSFYDYEMHLYDTENHYFIKIDNAGSDGLRISSRASMEGATYSSAEFDGLEHVETDEINLLDTDVNNFGSGKDWYGESFKFTTSRDYPFSFPQRVSNSTVRVRASAAGRSTSSTNHTFQIFYDGTFIAGANMGAISGNVEETYAQVRTLDGSFSPTGDNITLNLTYSKPNSVAEAWLDYVTVNARQRLVYPGQAFHFRDRLTINQDVSDYSLAGASSNLVIWDVSDPVLPVIQEAALVGNALQFGAPRVFGKPREFIAFQGNDFPAPNPGGAVTNQNLHSMSVPDMIIFTQPALAEAAFRLEAHREATNGIDIEVVFLEQAYNEFSTGNVDITAIRDLTTFLYEQDPDKLKYILLFGDASFDYRNIRGSSDNAVLVPTFETSVSNHPIRSFPTDDYFGLLDPSEGIINTGFLDIGVGRIPANSLSEANLTIDKIIRYETSPTTLGDWKNRLVFNADDEDNNLHLRDANLIADQTADANSIYNLEKIYFDAFRQISTPGGNRYPEATKAIDDNIFKGAMVINYMGHGGSNGWAQERVLTTPQIQEWNNSEEMPLFVTATCTFGPYDDPTIISAGEILVLKPDGGAIALFTTVRAVFASLNADSVKSAFK